MPDCLPVASESLSAAGWFRQFLILSEMLQQLGPLDCYRATLGNPVLAIGRQPGVLSENSDGKSYTNIDLKGGGTGGAPLPEDLDFYIGLPIRIFRKTARLPSSGQFYRALLGFA